MFNVQKLQKEIDAAGIPNDGVSADGAISFKESATAQHRAAADAIKAAHDPTDTSGALREAARQAFRSTDWQHELDMIDAGKAIVDDVQATIAPGRSLVAQVRATTAPGKALVTAIRNDAAIPAATRGRIADVLNGLIDNQTLLTNLTEGLINGTEKVVVVTDGLIDNQLQQGEWWFHLMRLQSMTDE